MRRPAGAAPAPDLPAIGPGSDGQRGRAATIIADQLRSEIVSGVRPPGSELPPEAEFLREAGVSKPSYRQALRILETEGFVKVSRGARGGVKVLKPDIEPITRYATALLQMNGATYEDIRNVRLAIEPTAARLVAERRSPEALSALAECAGSQRFKTHDPEAFVQDERRFRFLLAEHSGNVVLTLLAHLFATIHDKYAPRTTSVEHASDDPDRERAVRAKMKLIDVLSQGDGAAAEARWRAYVDEFTTKVLARESSIPSSAPAKAGATRAKSAKGKTRSQR